MPDLQETYLLLDGIIDDVTVSMATVEETVIRGLFVVFLRNNNMCYIVYLVVISELECYVIAHSSSVIGMSPTLA